VRRASVATSRVRWVWGGWVLIGLGNGETSQFRVQNPRGASREGAGPDPAARWSFSVGASRWCRCCGAACRAPSVELVWWRSIRESGLGRDDGRDGVGDSHSFESGRVVTRMAASAVWQFETSGFGYSPPPFWPCIPAGLTCSVLFGSLPLLFLCTSFFVSFFYLKSGN